MSDVDVSVSAGKIASAGAALRLLASDAATETAGDQDNPQLRGIEPSALPAATATEGGNVSPDLYARFGGRNRADPMEPAHGAVGDGASDDAAAWQSAIDALVAAGGGELVLTPTAYALASQVVVDGVTVVIRWAGASIAWTGDADQPAIAATNGGRVMFQPTLSPEFAGAVGDGDAATPTDDREALRQAWLLADELRVAECDHPAGPYAVGGPIRLDDPAAVVGAVGGSGIVFRGRHTGTEGGSLPTLRLISTDAVIEVGRTAGTHFKDFFLSGKDAATGAYVAEHAIHVLDNGGRGDGGKGASGFRMTNSGAGGTRREAVILGEDVTEAVLTNCNIQGAGRVDPGAAGEARWIDGRRAALLNRGRTTLFGGVVGGATDVALLNHHPPAATEETVLRVFGTSLQNGFHGLIRNHDESGDPANGRRCEVVANTLYLENPGTVADASGGSVTQGSGDDCEMIVCDGPNASLRLITPINVLTRRATAHFHARNRGRIAVDLMGVDYRLQEDLSSGAILFKTSHGGAPADVGRIEVRGLGNPYDLDESTKIIEEPQDLDAPSVIFSDAKPAFEVIDGTDVAQITGTNGTATPLTLNTATIVPGRARRSTIQVDMDASGGATPDLFFVDVELGQDFAGRWFEFEVELMWQQVGADFGDGANPLGALVRFNLAESTAVLGSPQEFFDQQTIAAPGGDGLLSKIHRLRGVQFCVTPGLLRCVTRVNAGSGAADDRCLVIGARMNLLPAG